MIKIFGRALCSVCQEKKAEFEAQAIRYHYCDLDTPDGLAEAAYHGLLGEKLSLPIIMEQDTKGDQTKDHNVSRKEEK